MDELPLKDSVSQYAITWTFDKPAREAAPCARAV